MLSMFIIIDIAKVFPINQPYFNKENDAQNLSKTNVTQNIWYRVFSPHIKICIRGRARGGYHCIA